MFIESIELKNYRNYGELHMDFDPGTNVLYGDNAQGKTNILEAVYVCATTKSHKTGSDLHFGYPDCYGRPLYLDGAAVYTGWYLLWP